MMQNVYILLCYLVLQTLYSSPKHRNEHTRRQASSPENPPASFKEDSGLMSWPNGQGIVLDIVRSPVRPLPPRNKGGTLMV